MAKVLKGIGKFLVSGVGGLVGGLFKKPKIPAPIGMPTRDEAAIAAEAEDELRKRKGAQADIITGVRGAEAVPTAGRLVRGN